MPRKQQATSNEQQGGGPLPPERAVKYSDELRAQAIAEWQAGASWSQLTTAYGVPKSTLRGWMEGRLRTVADPRSRTTSAPLAAPKKEKREQGTGNREQEPEPEQLRDAETIDDIAWRHVLAAGRATTAILRKVTDPEWLHEQDAGAVAKLYGVIADKEFRLLAAFHQRGDEDSSAGAEQPQLAERAGDTAQQPLG